MEKVIQSLRNEIEKRQAALNVLLSLGYGDEEEQTVLPIQKTPCPRVSRKDDVVQSILNVFAKKKAKIMRSIEINHELRNYFKAQDIRDALAKFNGKYWERLERGEYKLIADVTELLVKRPQERGLLNGKFIGTTAAIIKVLSRSKHPLSVPQIVHRLNGEYTDVQVGSVIRGAVQKDKYFTRVSQGLYALKQDESEAEESVASPVKHGSITEAIKEVLKRYAREMTVDEIASELSSRYTHRQVQSLLYCAEAKRHFDRVGKGTYVLKGMLASPKSSTQPKVKDVPINLAERIREHLKQADEALTVDEIVERLGDATKADVSTILYGYSYRGQYFKSGKVKDGVSTFELIAE